MTATAPPCVRITDAVVAGISGALADPAPERGGALLAVGDLVYAFIEDTAGRYTGVSWDISSALADAVGQAEAAHAGTLVGTVHSHPDGMPDPSGQDVVTMTEALDMNPHLDRLVVAVVTEGEPRALDVPVGDTHRLSLHVLLRDPAGGRPTLVRAEGRVVTIGAELAAAGCPLRSTSVVEEWVGRRRVPRPGEAPLGRVLTVDGRPRLLVETGADDRGALLVDAEHPAVGPIAVRRSGVGASVTALPSPWDPTAPPGPQVVGLARAAAGLRLEGATERTWPLVGSLAAKRVLVAGIGSVGTRIAEDLCRSGVGSFVVVDPDVVEASNLARTIFVAADVGRHKTDALADRLRAIDPAVTVEVYCATLGNVDLAGLVAGADLVIGAVDHMGEQATLAHHAYHRGVPMVACALYKAAAAGEVVLSVPSASTACWFCAVGDTSSSSQYRPDRDYGAGGRLAGEVALGPSIHLVANVATIAALGLLAGPGTPAWNRVAPLIEHRRTLGVVSTTASWEFFAQLFGGAAHQHAPQSVWVRVEGEPDCPICGAERIPPADAAQGKALTTLIRSLTDEATDDGLLPAEPVVDDPVVDDSVAHESHAEGGTADDPRPAAGQPAASMASARRQRRRFRRGWGRTPAAARRRTALRLRPTTAASPTALPHPPTPTTLEDDQVMAQKFSKRGQAPQKDRSLSSSNRTGGQNPLKEATKRLSKSQNNNHGTNTKSKGGRMF